MRGMIALAAAATLAFAPVSQAFAATVSKDQIEQSLTQQGYAVQDVGPHTLFVRVADYDIRIDVVGPDGDISYRAWLFEVDGKDISYKVLNEFNNDVKFGRVYIDEDGDVTLQMDRNGAGGSSIQNIESDFDVFLMLISSFMSHLESQVIA
ncbi:YbjN domain-containing protein [Hyphococcus flavus]|uniref:YbjN domain-containing protein n=1 Tax=Hyphococcus flavus TaxID=1866326 RepID=A0AAE9ZIT1_9PROT|nr:YbjN domain-containing protein [Hyphococcus flavus]WDI31140.1 YbjN domain-containing protein [Hyphococcus flavus]